MSAIELTRCCHQEPAAQAIGWALLQFVWQGTLIGALTAVILAALRRSDADVRYVVVDHRLVPDADHTRGHRRAGHQRRPRIDGAARVCTGGAAAGSACGGRQRRVSAIARASRAADTSPAVSAVWRGLGNLRRLRRGCWRHGRSAYCC